MIWKFKKSSKLVIFALFISAVFLFLILFSPFSIFNFASVNAVYSPDGINFTKQEKIWKFFAVQGGIRLKDGNIILSGIDFAKRKGLLDEKTGFRITDVGFLISEDGWHFTRANMSIQNLKRDIWTKGDPTIIQLPDGNYRMYFTDRANDRLASAFSENGYDYIYEGMVGGKVLTVAVDFTVLYEKRAKKYYIYTRSADPNGADILESDDGRNFTKRYFLKMPFAMKFSIVDEGDYYKAYGLQLPECQGNCRYPVAAISKDGLNWQKTEEQPIGTWKGNRFYALPNSVIKIPENGYIFYEGPGA